MKSDWSELCIKEQSANQIRKWMFLVDEEKADVVEAEAVELMVFMHEMS